MKMLKKIEKAVNMLFNFWHKLVKMTFMLLFGLYAIVLIYTPEPPSVLLEALILLLVSLKATEIIKGSEEGETSK